MDRRRKANTTIKDIARYTGYSFSTVAKALANDSAIRATTRKTITDAATKLNYHPNRLAKGLRKRQSRTIGVVLNDLTNPFYADIYKAIDTVARQKGYTMILSDSDFAPERERSNIATMISQGVEGLILSPVSEDLAGLAMLDQYGIHLVIVDCKPKRDGRSYVYVDHQLAATVATEHLIQNGHRNILLLNGPPRASSSRQYLRGYRTVLKKHGVDFDQELVLNLNLSIDAGYSAIMNIVTGNAFFGRVGPHDFTAIVTLSDLLALGVYKAAQEGHFCIPGDYSIIGYDNILATAFLAPPLTTVDQPKETNGTKSVNLLFDLIQGTVDKPKRITLTPKLIVRKSVKRI